MSKVCSDDLRQEKAAVWLNEPTSVASDNAGSGYLSARSNQSMVGRGSDTIQTSAGGPRKLPDRQWVLMSPRGKAPTAFRFWKFWMTFRLQCAPNRGYGNDAMMSALEKRGQDTC